MMGVCVGFLLLLNLGLIAFLLVLLVMYLQLFSRIKDVYRQIEEHRIYNNKWRRNIERLISSEKPFETQAHEKPIEQDMSEEPEFLKPLTEDVTEVQHPEESELVKSDRSEEAIRSDIKEDQKLEKPDKIANKKEKEGFFFKQDFEAYVGGRLLNRIGSIALILGIAFFLKFTFDQNLINEYGKTLIGTAIGILFLAGGYYFNKKEYYVFSQGMVGIGIASLYLVIYAAYNFFNILPYSLAILLMLVVTIIDVVNAIYYDAVAIAVLGVAGGFLTPFVLPVETPSFYGLFVYITFINLLICLLLYLKRSWRPIEFIGIISSFIIYFTWFFNNQHLDAFVIPLLFVLVTWLMYIAVIVSRYMYAEDSYPQLTMAANVLLFILFFLAYYSLIYSNYPDYTGISVLIISIIYFCSSYSLQRFFKNDGIINAQLTIMGMLLIIIATEIEMEGYLSIIILALEAMAFIYYGIKAKKAYVWQAALVIYLYTVVKIFTFNPFVITGMEEDPLFEANLRTLAYLVLSGSLALSGYMLEEFNISKNRIYLKEIIRYVWVIILFVFLGIEVSARYNFIADNLIGEPETFMYYSKYLSMALVWVLYSLPLVYYGLKKEIVTFITLGSVSLGIGILLAFAAGYTYSPLSYYVPVMNIRFFVFVILVAALIYVSKWVRIYGNCDAKEVIYSFLRYTWSIVLFLLFTVEVNDYFNKQIAIETDAMRDLMQYSRFFILSILWTVCGVALVNLGLTRKLSGYTIIGFISISMAILFSMVMGISFQPLEFYMPYLNVRFVSIAVLVSGLICIILVMKTYTDEYKWAPRTINLLRILTSIFLFLLLSYEFTDIFNKELYSVRQRVDIVDKEKIILIQNFKQLTISILWLVYSVGLMIFGIVRRIKVLRLTAICFFGLTIFKIFIIDLSFLDQLYRIFSFIGLGLILLLVSYLYQRYKYIIVENDETV
jgi:uncharacterized membrane protein